jgi:hypothetical protein
MHQSDASRQVLHILKIQISLTFSQSIASLVNLQCFILVSNQYQMSNVSIFSIMDRILKFFLFINTLFAWN